MIKSMSEMIPTQITIMFTIWAMTRFAENFGLLSLLSQNTIGRQNPTAGLLVAPMTVMASEMFGMNTASTKHVVTMINVHKRFSFLFI